MLPDFTAFMISSSLLSKVPPKNCMSSSPPDRLRTSSACQEKPIAPDSGTGMIWAITSLIGAARATVGARPLARMPARPPLIRPRRRTGRLRLLIFMMSVMARPPRRLSVLAATRPKALICEKRIPPLAGRERLLRRHREVVSAARNVEPVEHLARAPVVLHVILAVERHDAVAEHAMDADRPADGATAAARQVGDPLGRRDADGRGIEQQQVGVGADRDAAAVLET